MEVEHADALGSQAVDVGRLDLSAITAYVGEALAA
jgi:hypothetical protein